MAKAKKGNPTLLKLVEISQKYARNWEPDGFFADLLRCYGITDFLINKALSGEDNPVCHDLTEEMARGDLAVRSVAYFRFVKEPEEASRALNAVRELKEATSSRNRFQFIIAAGPGVLSMYDLVEQNNLSIDLSELPENYTFLLPIMEGRHKKVASTRLADHKACIKLTKLLETLASHNGLGHDDLHKLNDFICRLLFCFFAEDTGIFGQEENLFTKAFDKVVDRKGSNAREFFEDLFTVLNTPEDAASRAPFRNAMPVEILRFPYVNGGLFKEHTYIPDFDITTRNQIMDCGGLEWHEISPAVFGAMFQSAMDPKERRQNGAHYTSEENILKVIKPLFLNDLYAEFDAIKNSPESKKLLDDIDRLPAGQVRNKEKLNAQYEKPFNDFLDKLGSMRFLDPACGCGNFLMITYRELRRLENKVLKHLKSGVLSISMASRIKVDHFYGIEIEDWPAQIAHISMWLMMHVMNTETSKDFGIAIPSIPLRESVSVVCANALTTDWNEVLPAGKCSYVLGNPPFGGTTYTSSEQKSWLKAVYPPKYKTGLADYVTGWFVKAAEYISPNPSIRVGFVSTNSICQGEQVGTLWGLLLKKGVRIDFAYTSFPWSNDAANKAGVTCVIVGFSRKGRAEPMLFAFDRKTGKTSEQACQCISPYLVDARTPAIVYSHSKALSATLGLKFGNKAADGGNLLLEKDEGEKIFSEHPKARKFVKRFIGSSELMNSTWRYCLWLEDKDREEWSSIPAVMEHVEACRSFRESQVKTGDAFKLKDKPWRFREQNNPKSALVIPRVTSERRSYIPMGIVGIESIIGDAAFMLPDAGMYEFGILSSKMHMVWMRLTSGRMKTDFRYSRDMTFNTFIWPEVDATQKEDIESLAQEAYMMREDYPSMTLGDLYNPDTMPEPLKKAHAALDLAVDHAYRQEGFKDDEERLSFMLDLYADATAKEKK